MSKTYKNKDDKRASSGLFVCKDGHKEYWQLRYSKRAKRARIAVSPQKGIEVVLPTGSGIDPAVFVEEHRCFIDRALLRTRLQRESYLNSLVAPLPLDFDLPTAQESWHVEYNAKAARGVSYRTKEVGKTGATVLLSGQVDDVEAASAALRRFVIARAKLVLPRLLLAKADDLGLTVVACSVKNTRTRLGSCNSKGKIMLAAQLIFYPPELSSHIMCHELAHLKHLDHSAAFHSCLESFDPYAARHAQELRKASIYVPAWMNAD